MKRFMGEPKEKRKASVDVGLSMHRKRKKK